MLQTKQRRHAEDFLKVASQAGKHQIRQENIFLHFSRNVIDSAWILEAQEFPPLRKIRVRVCNGQGDGVVGQKGPRGRGRFYFERRHDQGLGAAVYAGTGDRPDSTFRGQEGRGDEDEREEERIDELLMLS